MDFDSPTIVILAGPNGAGKSTAAPALLRDYIDIRNFVNADAIASGLAAFDSASVAIEAGRIMLRRINELANVRADFAFETTLASRSFATWITQRQKSGYRVVLLFLWLKSPLVAEQRVMNRVREGGHSVPSETIHRRYLRGLRNLTQVYLPIVDQWSVFDSTMAGSPELVASGNRERHAVIRQPTWNSILEASR